MLELCRCPNIYGPDCFSAAVSSKLNRTFILTGCREYLTVLCGYDMTLVSLKSNGKMLMK